MSRFFYDQNGRSLNRQLGESLEAEETAALAAGGQPMEIKGATVSGHAARLEKTYMFLAKSLVSKMKAEELRMRTLASGLFVYSAERNVRLEPGIEAVMPPDDTLAFNYNNLFTPPAS